METTRNWSDWFLVFPHVSDANIVDSEGNTEQLEEKLSNLRILLSCKVIFSTNISFTAVVALHPSEERNVNTITSAI